MSPLRLCARALVVVPLLAVYLLISPMLIPQVRPPVVTARAQPPPSPVQDSAGQGTTTAIPATGPAAATTIQVPILMYHYIRDSTNPKDLLGVSLSVSPAAFAEQMDWLRSAGMTPIDFNDLFAYSNGQFQLPARPVIITFDDGYSDLYTSALPVLRAHGFKAVAYIVTGFLGRKGYLTADQVVELSRSGVEIGSHTVDHLDLRTVRGERLRAEIGDARTYLEALIGQPVLDFCYPGGRFDPTVVAAVKAAGYRSATTTQLSYDHSMLDTLTWGRIRISGGESLAQYAAALGG